jgi:hypothetical protein
MKEVDTMTNTTPKKPTKKENFTRLLNLAEVQSDPALVEFIKHELELLVAKNDRKPTKKEIEKQAHDADLRSAILAEMEANQLYTADEMVKSLPTLSTEPGLTAQKVSKLMADLLALDKVSKTTEKRRVYWQVK